MSSRFDLVGIGMTSQRTRNRLVERLREKGISDEAVLAAIGSVPRHIFIDEALSHRAYEDSALPIGQGQTISQPFVVALMSQVLLAGLSAAGITSARVLEVGTGSGYQTAILASLMGQGGQIDRLYTIERLDGLIERARERLDAMGQRAVRYRHGDGYQGWPESAPFTGILVTAAPPSVPAALLEQLAVGGRMVVPVGGRSDQALMVYDRTESGIISETVEQVRFVPLVKGMA